MVVTAMGPLMSAVGGLLRGLGVRVRRPDVCRAGARVDRRPEGEAETEALQSWDLTCGPGFSDLL